jgi:ubiquinone/menaquinone biosynthesis C-methylase UbiE
MTNSSTNENTCSVCSSTQTKAYIQTNAMMHRQNTEIYNFNYCQSCQSVFLGNPVSSDSLTTYYTEHYLPYKGSAAWGKFSNFVEWDDAKLNEKRKKVVRPYLQKQTSVRVLDVGCGKPDFLAHLSQDPSISCTGVDFVSADWGNPKYANLTLNACDWKTVQFDEKFHLITAWHYLEHDYDLKTTVNRFYDLLEPNGFVIIEVPMYEGILQKLQKKYWQGWHTPRHITLFSRFSWTVLFPKDKWKLVRHQSYGTLSAFTLWWLGHRQKQHTNWSESMEPYFWSLVAWKIILAPIFVLEKIIPFGIQTVVLQKR